MPSTPCSVSARRGCHGEWWHGDPRAHRCGTKGASLPLERWWAPCNTAQLSGRETQRQGSLLLFIFVFSNYLSRWASRR